MTAASRTLGSAGDTARRRAASSRPGAVLAATLAVAGAAAVLLWCYHRLSWTVPATSDGAAIALQAQDMLHGNWLLHGWTVGDVTFHTTELPEYAAIEWFRGLGPGVIHAAAAVTYTLLVLLAGLLARGRAHGRDGVVRALLASGIMLAPQLGYGAFVLLLSPDHVGTQVPLLAGWLLLDLAPRRWWVPVALGALLASVQFSDRVALVTAVVPLCVVCGARVARTAVARRSTRRSEALGTGAQPDQSGPVWRARAYELSLAAAAVASVAASWAAARLLTSAGGYTAHPLPMVLAPLRLLWTHTWLTGWGILELYGANFAGLSGWVATLFAVAHLAGLALGVAGFAVALRRFLLPRAEPDLVDSVLAVAIVCNLVLYILSIEPGTVLGTGYNAREIAAVLPLGAVLAGRVIGPKLTGHQGHQGRPGRQGRETPRVRSEYRTFLSAQTSRALLLSAVLACYAAALGYGAAQPAVPPRNAVLASWLTAHHLRYGLAGAVANITTVDSGGRAELAVVAVSGGQVRARLYQSKLPAYDPRLHYANFLVAGAPADGAGYAPESIPLPVARRTFGPPARVYHFHGYTVMVWDVNLLTRLGNRGHPAAM
jgi:hypothetical protein